MSGDYYYNIKNATWKMHTSFTLCPYIRIEIYKMYGCKWLGEKIEIVFMKRHSMLIM
jgi:hypothetical protein